jgi:hypothetical protein
MPTKTLLQLRTETRQRADMESSRFISDSELTGYINAAYSELYDLLVGQFEDYYTIYTQVTVPTGNSTISLPTDFYKLRGIDYQNSAPGDWVSVTRFAFPERNARGRVASRLYFGVKRLAYSVVGGQIRLLPEDDASGVYRIWYIPRFDPLVSDGSTVSNVLDFEDYIVVDAAIRCLVKEESDPSALMMQKEALKARINAMASQRDASGTGRIADVQTASGYLEDFFPY